MACAGLLPHRAGRCGPSSSGRPTCRWRPRAARARRRRPRASCRGDAGFRADRDVRLHAALPERVPAVAVGRVDGAAHAVLVVPHVAVGHRDGVDVRVDERRIPGHRVRDAVDVVPAAGVEADEVRAQRGADLHQLEARLELLDEHVDLDRADREAELLERRQDVVPERRFFGGLDLRQVQHQRRAGVAQPLVVVDDVERASTIDAEKPAPSACRT